MKKNLKHLTILAIGMLCLVLAGCGPASQNSGAIFEASLGNTSAVYEHNYSGTGCGFNLPDDLKDLKGVLYDHDFGEIGEGTGVYQASLLYLPCSEKEYRSSVTSGSGKIDFGEVLTVYCVNGSRDGEQGLRAVESAIKAENGSLTDEEATMLKQAEQVASEGEFTWFVTQSGHSDSITEEPYKSEYETLCSSTDKIIENFSFYAPDQWDGKGEGAAVSFRAADLDGNDISSDNLFSGNRINVLTVWTTGCQPCSDALQDLETLKKEYADKGVAFAGIVADADGSDEARVEAARKIVEEKGISFINICSWSGFDQTIPVKAVPSTIFIDSSGRMIGAPVTGSDLKTCRETIERLLGETDEVKISWTGDWKCTGMIKDGNEADVPDEYKDLELTLADDGTGVFDNGKEKDEVKWKEDGNGISLDITDDGDTLTMKASMENGKIQLDMDGNGKEILVFSK